MDSLRLYAIVFRMAALRPGAVPADHGDQARAALLNLIRDANVPLAGRLHDSEAAKPYAISLLQAAKRGRDGALHFGLGDSADWRFCLLGDPEFEALLQHYLLTRALPHARIGAVDFQISEIFASGRHSESGFTTLADLRQRHRGAGEPTLSLDFLSPTAFSLGRDAEGRRRIESLPTPRLIFSALRKRWVALGGSAPGDEFDEWIGQTATAEPVRLETRTTYVERVPVPGFVGRVRFRLGRDPEYMAFAHTLADLAFWTGVGYQTTRGMGQTRRVAG